MKNLYLKFLFLCFSPSCKLSIWDLVMHIFKCVIIGEATHWLTWTCFKRYWNFSLEAFALLSITSMVAWQANSLNLTYKMFDFVFHRPTNRDRKFSGYFSVWLNSIQKTLFYLCVVSYNSGLENLSCSHQMVLLVLSLFVWLTDSFQFFQHVSFRSWKENLGKIFAF